MSKASPAILVPRIAAAVTSARSAVQARDGLVALVARQDVWTPGAPVVLPASARKSFPATLAAEAGDRAAVLDRRLNQCIRALWREGSARASPAATRVLTHDAVRLLIEASGWRRLAQLVQALPSKASTDGVHHQEARAQAHQLRFLLEQTENPDRHRAIAVLAFAPAPVADLFERADRAESHLSSAEATALVDVLQSLDPSHGALVRDRLAHGGGLSEVRDLLVSRLLPVSAAQRASPVEMKRSGKKVEGLIFDLGINKWVEKDRSWAYPIRLGQLFEYIVDGVIDGEEELKARLVAAATDPVTGDAAVDPEAIRTFIDDLSAASGSDDPAVRALLDVSLELCFSTTDGGDKPVGALWELPLPSLANLFAAITDPKAAAHIAQAAKKERKAAEARRRAIFEPLRELLERYPGVPRRHKRAHGALINIGLAGQSMVEIARPDGVLPREKTLLEPEDLKTRYADAEHLKVRFLFTDEYELMVVSDQTFKEVVAQYGFPPNHELLSYGHPIADSGYLTLHQGRIVGLEDDLEMLPDKLPKGLAPAREVLRLRGFDLDESAIDASSRVIDWAGFASPPKGAAPSASSEGDVREALIRAPHAERAGLLRSVLSERLEAERSSGGPEEAAQAKVASYAEKILEGFQLINVGAKDFRSGDLPTHLDEFKDLTIDGALSKCLVRKVAA